MQRPILSLSIMVLLAAAAPAHAGSAPGASQTRCEKEVREFQQAMQFIRSTAGGSIVDRVAAGVASEGDVRKLAQEQGACAAAQLIRERTAKR